ncbi:MAG: hypothetical protein QF903_07965 [Planctomycetota bacterium]|jgi:hypothetical protein|nr:hypothetical protein [Planctomycetota bacterium]MDP6761384.1 hypothetical protein [Planctomycetota bacterium]MDP6989401.1 hypothetical protein [Planctomycetota bacterium]
MGRVIIGVLIGLALGLAVGSVWFSGSGGGAGLRPGGAAPLALERLQSEDLAAPSAAAPPWPSDAETEVGVIETPSEHRVTAALESTRRIAARRHEGEGAIWGTITTGDGLGVGGVTVRAVLRDPSSMIDSPEEVGAAPPDLSLEAAVQAAAEEHARVRAGLFEARSDASGAYRIEGLPGRQFRLTAHLDGWQCDALVGRYYRVSTDVDDEHRQLEIEVPCGLVTLAPTERG